MTIIRKEVIGNQTLLLGDCLEIMPTLGRFDAVVTDPPYGQNYKAPAPRKSAASKRGLNGNWVRKGDRPSADTVINDNREIDLGFLVALAPHVLVWGVHKLAHQFPKGQWLVWDKRCDLPAIDQGDGEAAWVNREGPLRILRHKWAGLIIEPNTEESARAGRGGAAQPRLHPTQKPVRVMQWSISQFPSAKAILDPFMGSGTTLLACEKMGLSGTGVEIDPTHFQTACERVHKAWQEPDLFIAPTVKPTQEAFGL